MANVKQGAHRFWHVPLDREVGRFKSLHQETIQYDYHRHAPNR